MEVLQTHSSLYNITASLSMQLFSTGLVTVKVTNFAYLERAIDAGLLEVYSLLASHLIVEEANSVFHVEWDNQNKITTSIQLCQQERGHHETRIKTRI